MALFSLCQSVVRLVGWQGEGAFVLLCSYLEDLSVECEHRAHSPSACREKLVYLVRDRTRFRFS